RDLLSLSLVGPASSTYGDQVTYAADLNPALGASGPANGTIHLMVDGIEKSAHTLVPSDFSNGSATFTFSVADLSATTHSIFATYDGDTHGLSDTSSNSISTAVATRTLTVSARAQDKTYDGTTSATVTLSDNRVAGDTFTETFTSASFSDKNAGTNKTVMV